MPHPSCGELLSRPGLVAGEHSGKIALRRDAELLDLAKVVVHRIGADEKLASDVRGQSSVRAFGHQKSAPLGVISNST